MSKRKIGLLALLGATLFWGGGPVITKLGLEEIPPFTFVFLRLTLALLTILPFFFIFNHHRIAKKDIFKIILVGFFGSGLNGLFFISGISHTTATTAASIFATVPLINSIAAAFILREKPTKVRIIGVVIGLIGSLIITLGPNLTKQNVTGDVLGNLLIMGAVFSWVAYIIISKGLLKKYSPLTLTTYSFLVGTIMLFPLTIIEFLNQPDWYLNVTALGMGGIIYGALFAGILAFLLFQIGTKYTSAFSAGVSTYLQPVLTAIVAAPILGEVPTPIFLIGTSLILGGVFLATSFELIKRRRVTV